MGSWVGCSACPFKDHPDTQCWAGTYAVGVPDPGRQEGDEETPESYRRMNYERSTGRAATTSLPKPPRSVLHRPSLELQNSRGLEHSEGSWSTSLKTAGIVATRSAKVATANTFVGLATVRLNPELSPQPIAWNVSRAAPRLLQHNQPSNHQPRRPLSFTIFSE